MPLPINTAWEAPGKPYSPYSGFRWSAVGWKEAKAEARELDRKLDGEFFAKKDLAGVPFNRDQHYTNWTQAHTGVGSLCPGFGKDACDDHTGPSGEGSSGCGR